MRIPEFLAFPSNIYSKLTEFLESSFLAEKKSEKYANTPACFVLSRAAQNRRVFRQDVSVARDRFSVAVAGARCGVGTHRHFFLTKTTLY